MRLEFQKQVVEGAGAAWPAECGLDEKWTAVTGALIEPADVLLGKVKGCQPDWFRESMGTLKPLLQSRNCAYTKWLASRKGAAKNSWFHEKAEEAEKEHFGGKKVWKCIRDMQHGCRGL